MEVNYKEVGARIRNRRKQISMTQKKLAELVNLSEGSVSRYESGSIKDAPTQKLHEFANALGVEVTWLIGFTPSTDKYKIVNECMNKIQNLDDKKCMELVSIINKLIKMLR